MSSTEDPAGDEYSLCPELSDVRVFVNGYQIRDVRPFGYESTLSPNIVHRGFMEIGFEDCRDIPGLLNNLRIRQVKFTYQPSNYSDDSGLTVEIWDTFTISCMLHMGPPNRAPADPQSGQVAHAPNHLVISPGDVVKLTGFIDDVRMFRAPARAPG